MTRSSRFAARAAVLACLILSSPLVLAADDDGELLDGFESADGWRALASDEVQAQLRVVEGVSGSALCLDYDFGRVSGHAALRRKLPLTFPENYEFSFRLRGRAPVNDLEFKLIDASGDNVWWVKRPRYTLSDDWQEVRYRKRHIDFAWGPLADRSLRKSSEIEFTVYAHEGGRGEICFDELRWRPLPPLPAQPPAPKLSASSTRTGYGPEDLLADAPQRSWCSAADASGRQWLQIDLGMAREIGGLMLHWLPGQHPAHYTVSVSDDGRQWREIRRVEDGDGGHDALHLPETETPHLRLGLPPVAGDGYGLARIELLPPMPANAFFERLAAMAPRGHFPRGFSGEQSYWTVVGLDGGLETALLSEDGALEVARGGFSVEPFLLVDGALVSWADVSIEHELADGYLPMPRVRWRRDDLRLTVSAFAEGEPHSSRLLARYRIDNAGTAAREVTLALALRPFQVNPPSQFLNIEGGVSPIRRLSWADGALRVDGQPRLRSPVAPDAFVARRYDQGMLPLGLSGDADGFQQVDDSSGYATGALLYRLQLLPGEGATVALDIPMTGAPAAIIADASSLADTLDRHEAQVAALWREKLDRVRLTLPAQAQPLADTLRTALAHVLINRHGVEIRPGSRSYNRSWIRDGAMTSEALLRLGHGEAAAEFLRWYAPYQFANGKVPCCVDYRGSDPVPENDSHGELIHLVAEVWRHGRDRQLLEAMWPHVAGAVRYMDELRLSERTSANRTAERRPQYGLMPPSISHEGYSAKPAYSHWDNFWSLVGYDQAVALAQVLGRDREARRWARSRDQFRADVLASIRASARLHDIDFIPGAAELGDFDATSTTIALSPGAEQSRLPADLLGNTFERYWREFVERRDGSKPWEVYTPYEWRNVGAFVRLGWPERAHQALDWFMADRRPAAWNQWAEVVGREPRTPRFIGDMPHGWVASDFIRSALDLFAYERPADGALVLAAGVPPAWLDGEGVAIEGLRTPWGRLGYRYRRDGAALQLDIDGDGVPPGGFVLAVPDGFDRFELDGGVVEVHRSELRIRDLPARLRLFRAVR